MPFTTLIKSKAKAIGITIVITLLLSLVAWGAWNSYRLSNAETDLATANNNISSLEVSLEAEKNKAVQRERDAQSKQDHIQKLNNDKRQYAEDFHIVRDNVNMVIHTATESRSEDDVSKANVLIQLNLNASLRCIEAATGGSQCDSSQN